ncbi:MAG: DUF3021 family protein [Clostridia bacterium]|nr:DUF3021 family protein [Clostridia bacterium]
MIKKFFNNIILPGCVFYTLISLFFVLTSFTLDKNIPAIATSNLVVIALFSLLISVFNLIFKIKSLHVYIRIPLHYIVSALSLYLVLLISAGDIISNTQNLRFVLVLFYTIIYVISTVVYICIRETRKNPKVKEKTDYNSIYNK